MKIMGANKGPKLSVAPRPELSLSAAALPLGARRRLEVSEDSAGHYGAEAKKKHGQGGRRGLGCMGGEKEASVLVKNTELSRSGLQLSVNILS